MLLVGAAATLPILAAMGFQARAVLQDNLERQQRDADQLLVVAAGELELRLSLEERLLRALARAPGLTEVAGRGDCQGFAQATAAKDEAAAIVSLRNPQGTVICSSTGVAVAGGDDPAYFADALRLKRLVIGDYRIARSMGRGTLTLVLPITDAQGEVRALLTSTLNLRFLEDELARMNPTAQTNIVLVNGVGLILSPLRWTGDSVAEHPVMKRIAAAPGQLRFEAVGIDGHERIFAAKPVRSAANDRLYLWVAASRSDIVAGALRQFASDTLALTAMMVALIVALWYYGNRWVLQPLARLREAAATLGKAHLSARTELPHGDDEIGQLAASFDAMAEQMERHVKRIAADLVEIRAADVTTRKLSRVVEQSPAIVVITDTHGVIEYVNPKFTALTGYSAAEAIGRTPALLKSGTTPAEVYREMWATLLDGRQWRGELLNRKKNGELFWENTRISPLMDDSGRITHFIAVKEDITERRKVEAQLHKLSLAVEHSPVSVMITDEKGTIEYVNPRFTEVTGFAANEVFGKTPRILKSGTTAPQVYHGLWQAITSGREWSGELQNRNRRGELFWESEKIAPIVDIKGKISHFVALKEDITERKNYQAELERQATRDSLTGLPNRSLLADRMTQALAQAHRSGHAAAVLMVDLDNFKLVNDSLGHATGDLLVKAVAERLSACVREGDTVARMGGDEFVLIMHHVRDETDVTAMMQRIVTSIGAPLSLEGRELHVTCSTGAAIYPKDGSSGEELLRNADTAMYRAKEQGRDSFRFYTADMNQRMMERLTLEAELRLALDRRQFTLHFQPQVDTVSGALIGAEALLRWSHAELGMIPPSRFIPLAEETGLIVPLGEWILREACAQSRRWQEAGLPALRLAVNISARQFRQKDFVGTVTRILAETGLSADLLELELTESMVMHNPDEAVKLLHELKRAGVHISLDDFGTGYSSLSHLKRFPIDVLKLDQSFVRGVLSDADDAAIARTVIGLGHSLNLRVIAEGVETEAQKAFLAAEKCDAMQGYLFSRPLPATAFAALLQSAAAPDDGAPHTASTPQ